jgi:hypothetical protein
MEKLSHPFRHSLYFDAGRLLLHDFDQFLGPFQSRGFATGRF